MKTSNRELRQGLNDIYEDSQALQNQGTEGTGLNN
jgi:hypothetical protein